MARGQCNGYICLIFAKKSENDHETSPQYFTAAVTAEITLALRCKESLRKPVSVVGCGVMTLLCQ